MKPTPTQLALVIANLTKFIPPPPRPKVKQQKSKWGLKVGQGMVNATGDTFTVVDTTSEAVLLESADGRSLRITDQSALSTLSKVAKRRARKKASVPRDDKGGQESGTLF